MNPETTTFEPENLFLDEVLYEDNILHDLEYELTEDKQLGESTEDIIIEKVVATAHPSFFMASNLLVTFKMAEGVSKELIVSTALTKRIPGAASKWSEFANGTTTFSLRKVQLKKQFQQKLLGERSSINIEEDHDIVDQQTCKRKRVSGNSKASRVVRNINLEESNIPQSDEPVTPKSTEKPKTRRALFGTTTEVIVKGIVLKAANWWKPLGWNNKPENVSIEFSNTEYRNDIAFLHFECEEQAYEFIKTQGKPFDAHLRTTYDQVDKTRSVSFKIEGAVKDGESFVDELKEKIKKHGKVIDVFVKWEAKWGILTFETRKEAETVLEAVDTARNWARQRMCGKKGT
jgi:hypothetical protein